MKKNKIIGIIAILFVAIIVFAAIKIAVNKNEKAAYSISIIGGADGPTSVFIAGKVGGKTDGESTPSIDEIKKQVDEQIDNQDNIREEINMDYKQITPEQAKAIMDDKNTGAIVVDVRRPDEYAEGHIENAINIPNESIIDTPPTELPDKDQLILVHCRSGRRSKEAAIKLADMGYTNIYDFGGILDWPYEIIK